MATLSKKKIVLLHPILLFKSATEKEKEECSLKTRIMPVPISLEIITSHFNKIIIMILWLKFYFNISNGIYNIVTLVKIFKNICQFNRLN
jgi:hypothetical protein